MKPVTLNLPERYIRELDRLVKRGFYPSRAEAIRLAIRDLLLTHNLLKLKPTEPPKMPIQTLMKETLMKVLKEPKSL